MEETKEHDGQWILGEELLSIPGAGSFHENDTCGDRLPKPGGSDLMGEGFTLGPAKLNLDKRDGEWPGSPVQSCQPNPCKRHHVAYTYTENCTLEVTESGVSDFLEPCHEFKAFIHCRGIQEEIDKFIKEVIRFGAACMNSRTNGTIHFGVGDEPKYHHGEILGVRVQSREAYVKALPDAIEGYFEHKHLQAAKKCIKTPRFVEVIAPDKASTGRYVIEVDVVPDYMICKDDVYHVYNADRKNGKIMKKCKEEMKRFFYIRDGASSKDLSAQSDQYEGFIQSIGRLSLLRKQADERHLSAVKQSIEGFWLKRDPVFG